MNAKKISIGIAAALAGLVMARTAPAIAAPAASSDAKQMLQSRLGGQLAVTVIEQDGAGYRVRAELRNPTFSQSPSPKDDVTPLLAKPFYFTVMPDGQMQSFYFAKGLPMDERILLKQIATSMQAVMPATPAAKWATTEEDVSGQYLASYSVDGNTITRAKSKYVQANGLGGLMPMPANAKYEVQGTTRYELAPSGWAQRVSTDESYEVHIAQSDVAVTTRTTLSLGDVVFRGDLVGHMPADVEPEAAANARTAADRQKTADVRAVADRSFDDLIKALQDPQKKVSDEALTRLPSYFRLNPGALSKAEGLVLEGKDDTATHRLVYTIGKTGTAESEATLVELLQGNKVEWQIDAAMTLGMLEKPRSSSAAALTAALADKEPRVAQVALLAVGNMAKRMAGEEGHSDTAERLVGSIVTSLKEAQDDFGRELAIKALGNTGHQQTLTVVEPYLTATNPQLRTAALMALRFTPGEAADKAIVAALGDTDVNVRSAAVRTISTRPVTALLPALTQLMAKETNKDVQFAVVHGLNSRLNDGPGVAALLQQIATSQPQAQVRDLAKQMVATN